MRKLIVIFLIGLILGCSPKKTDPKVIAIKVNDYEMPAGEFETEFAEAKAIRENTLKSKDQFIQEVITRKTLLQEAQRQGIDKEEDFLKSVERFWEQSLITILLNRKSRQIAATAKVTDEEIEDYFNKLTEEQKGKKSLEELQPQIKTMLRLFKESEKLDGWAESIKEKSNIVVNKSVIKEE